MWLKTAVWESWRFRGCWIPQEVKDEIRKAREIAGPGGVIGVNIMGVIGRFTQLLNAAIEEKVDLIVQGAGFRYDTFDMAKAANIPVFSIASSLKVAQKAEAAGAAAIVIEGADAGGHLGFPHGKPFRKTIDILKEVVAAGIKLPLIAAGGIFSGADIVEMLRNGASGVQMATRFVSTEECDANIKFKEAHLNAKQEDVVIIHSPVGLPGRACARRSWIKYWRGLPLKLCRKSARGVSVRFATKVIAFLKHWKRPARGIWIMAWFLPEPMSGASKNV